MATEGATHEAENSTFPMPPDGIWLSGSKTEITKFAARETSLEYVDKAVHLAFGEEERLEGLTVRGWLLNDVRMQKSLVASETIS